MATLTPFAELGTLLELLARYPAGVIAIGFIVLGIRAIYRDFGKPYLKKRLALLDADRKVREAAAYRLTYGTVEIHQGRDGSGNDNGSTEPGRPGQVRRTDPILKLISHSPEGSGSPDDDPDHVRSRKRQSAGKP